MTKNLLCTLGLTLACSLLPAQTSPATSDDPNAIDSQPSRVFRVNVRALLNQDNFAELETIADSARIEKARLPGGAWKLNAFYSIVAGPGSLTSTDDVWNAHIARLNRWAEAFPNSITPRVALGMAYTRYAWKARGNGWANTVTPTGWQMFKSRIQQARTTLEAAQTLSRSDPQWYHAMQTVALAQGWSREDVTKLVDSAIATEPGYYYVYIAQASFLLPKWYGKNGEAEAFVESAPDSDEGNIVYFRVAEAMDCCGKKNELPALSWSRVKRGFAALDKVYGTVNHQRNVMAYLAVRNNDQAYANEMFAHIGDDWDRSVWESKANFDNRAVVTAAAEGQK